MNVSQQTLADPIHVAKQLADQFALTACERDKAGRNPKAERDLIRQSGLLGYPSEAIWWARYQLENNF